MNNSINQPGIVNVSDQSSLPAKIIQNQSTQQASVTCSDCGSPFSYTPIRIGHVTIKPSMCPNCSNKYANEYNKRIHRILHNPEAKTTTIPNIPYEFNNTNPTMLPIPELLEISMKWSPKSNKGLVFYGPSGSGKSRCAYEIIKKYSHPPHCLNCKIVTACDMSSYPSKIAENPTKANAWLQSILNADITLLDDIFKSTMTERVQEAIFIIVDFRTTNNLPIIITLNEKASTLAQRLTPDRSAPIIRRLQQFCSIIKIEETTTTPNNQTKLKLSISNPW